MSGEEQKTNTTSGSATGGEADGAVTAIGDEDVSCIVVTYRTGPPLFECLARLLAAQSVREIIVVNNGNDAAATRSIEAMARDDPRVRVLTPERNVGFAAGCNLGAAHARSGYLAFVNPDCLVPADAFAILVGLLRRRPDAWLCGGRLLNMDGTEQRGGRRNLLTPWHAFVELTGVNRLFPNHPHFRPFNRPAQEAEPGVVEVPTVSGAFMVMPRRCFDAVGGWDDNMFLHVDDADLCIRVLKAGGKVLYCGNVPVRHHRGTSDAARITIEWHKTRSTSYYFYKHFHDTYPAWVLLSVSVLLWVRFVVVMVKELPHDVRRLARRRGDGRA
jgi:hypothetical protein